MGATERIGGRLVTSEQAQHERKVRHMFTVTRVGADLVQVSTATTSVKVHREDADPEHRFGEYRAAARFFGNVPQGA